MVKGGDQLARGGIPEFRSLIRTRRQDPSTIWTKRSVVDPILMGEGGYQLARGCPPELGAVIRAHGQDPGPSQRVRHY